MKVAVRRYKLLKLAQYLSDIKGFIHAGGTGSMNNQTSLDRLCQLTDGTQDPEDIMNLLENWIFELKAANSDGSLDQLVVVLGNLAGRARELQAGSGYDWFAVLLYLSTALGTVVIVRLWIGPPPSYGSPENYKWLPAVLVCTLVSIVQTRHPIRWDLEVPPGIADDSLAILTQPIQQEEPHRSESIHILHANHPQPVVLQQEEPCSTESIQVVQHEEPRSTESILDASYPQPIQQAQARSTESILDANQVEAATASIHISMGHCQIIPVSSPQPNLSDSECGSSCSSNDEIINFWHAPLNSLDAGDVNLIDPDFIHMLQEKTRGLSAADATAMVRTVLRDCLESDKIYRYASIS
jgi:hypothetical protein